MPATATGAADLTAEQRLVLFEAVRLTTVPGGQRVGPQGPVLRGAELYRYLGEPAWARQYAHAEGDLRRAATIGNLAIQSGMPLFMLGSLGFACAKEREVLCHRGFSVARGFGAVVAVAGAALMAVALLVEPDPIAKALVAERVREFNQEMRAELELAATP